MYTEDSGNATPPVSHCDHNKIKCCSRNETIHSIWNSLHLATLAGWNGKKYWLGEWICGVIGDKSHDIGGATMSQNISGRTKGRLVLGPNMFWRIFLSNIGTFHVSCRVSSHVLCLGHTSPFLFWIEPCQHEQDVRKRRSKFMQSSGLKLDPDH